MLVVLKHLSLALNSQKKIGLQPTNGIVELQLHATTGYILHRFWGTEHWSSCLLDKHFFDKAIFPNLSVSISWAECLHAVSHVLWKLKIVIKWCLYLCVHMCIHMCRCLRTCVCLCGGQCQVSFSIAVHPICASMYICTEAWRCAYMWVHEHKGQA